MVLLSRIVDRVFMGGESLAGVSTSIFLLLGAVVVRAGLLWVREVTAQRGAVRIKSELRKRLFAHILNLGPAYASGERSAYAYRSTCWEKRIVAVSTRASACIPPASSTTRRSPNAS
jgi:ATP-binding cassette, subfamily C, bacterial CydD